MKAVIFSAIVAAGVLSAGMARAQTVPEVAKTQCGKCHELDKKKKGPSFQDSAKKYKGKADAEAKLTAMLSKGAKIKVDGQEEDHKTVKGGDAAVAGSIAKWILAM